MFELAIGLVAVGALALFAWLLSSNEKRRVTAAKKLHSENTPIIQNGNVVGGDMAGRDLSKPKTNPRKSSDAHTSCCSVNDDSDSLASALVAAAVLEDTTIPSAHTSAHSNEDFHGDGGSFGGGGASGSWDDSDHGSHDGGSDSGSGSTYDGGSSFDGGSDSSGSDSGSSSGD